MWSTGALFWDMAIISAGAVVHGIFDTAGRFDLRVQASRASLFARSGPPTVGSLYGEPGSYRSKSRSCLCNALTGINWSRRNSSRLKSPIPSTDFTLQRKRAVARATSETIGFWRWSTSCSRPLGRAAANRFIGVRFRATRFTAMAWVTFWRRLTSVRANEIADALVAAIKFEVTDSGRIPYLEIIDEMDSGSERNVPVPDILLEMGFLEYRVLGRNTLLILLASWKAFIAWPGSIRSRASLFKRRVQC
jgi:hypothetical protein